MRKNVHLQFLQVLISCRSDKMFLFSGQSGCLISARHGFQACKWCNFHLISGCYSTGTLLHPEMYYT